MVAVRRADHHGFGATCVVTGMAMGSLRQVAIAIFVATCTTAAPAGATQVHRCRAADGSVVFRDAPCALGETTIDRREFADAAPSAVAARSQPATSSRARQAGPRAAGVRQAAAARDGRIVAHECHFGEQRWVQADTCPRSLALAAGHDGGKAPRPLTEIRLTAAQVCGALRHTSSADAPGKGSARRGYGMNRLRQLHGC